MTVHDKVSIRTLPTGVPGLDEILGGAGVYFNIIAGAPGGGKTPRHQSCSQCHPERPAST